jgi:hypothetical protein
VSNRPEAVHDRRRRLLTAAYTLVGAALFVYVVQRTGVADILEGIDRVGWGLAAILALGGLRFMLRAASWRLCLAPGTTLTYTQALAAFLAGDAVGSVTPLGLLASEPTKILLTRRHLATRESVASLAVENLIYAASVVGMVAVGLAVILALVPLTAAERWWMAAALIGVLAAGPVALRLLGGTWDASRGARPRWRERIAGVRIAVLGFLVFEALNRVVTVVFKFVPFRIGVDEALSGAMAPLLAVNPAAGVALAIVRKVRSLFWSAVGLGIIAAHPSKAR